MQKKKKQLETIFIQEKICIGRIKKKTKKNATANINWPKMCKGKEKKKLRKRLLCISHPKRIMFGENVNANL